MEKSNVVINLLGPRRNCKDRNEFEYINIEVPKRIARACAKNPNVLRFIHFSSAGARANSDSLDLQTKFFGE
jgi:NADH dehydrogenase (ubiquinone) 1 alpha subcomplex subunit 9